MERIKTTIYQLKKIRAFTLKTLEGFSVEQLLKIPEGFSNNICWNLGHLIVVHQIIHYKFSSLELEISKNDFERYCKGSSPQGWSSSPSADEIEQIKTRLIQQADLLLENYLLGKFKPDRYRSYETSSGVFLKSVEDAISFSNYHEGIHFGTILALRKFV